MLRNLGRLLYLVLLFIAIVSGILLFVFFINKLQELLFLPDDYEMWVSRQPYANLFIVVVFLIAPLFKRDEISKILQLGFFKENKNSLISSFIALIAFICYFMITGVTVLTEDEIIHYSFFDPSGSTYSYHDIVKIDTGIYGKKVRGLYHYSKGDFFYIIELANGEKINLDNMGGVKNDLDHRFMIEIIDQKLVNMHIPKSASMDNFDYAIKNLDKTYTDKIRAIIENTH